jgi:Fe-S-cluster containining protein
MTHANHQVIENTISGKICETCGDCCRRFPFIELSQEDIHTLEKATGLRSDEFANHKRKQVEEYFLRFKENGDCLFFKENNGHYSCAVYEARPEICRDYPLTPRQNEICGESRRVIQSNNSG